MCSVPLTPVSAAAGTFRERLCATPVAAAFEGPPAVSRIPSSAGPPLRLGSRGHQQANRGSAGHFGLIVLGDGVVPDLPFIVCVVLLRWVHAPRVGGHLGLTDADLNEEGGQKNICTAAVYRSRPPLFRTEQNHWTTSLTLSLFISYGCLCCNRKLNCKEKKILIPKQIFLGVTSVTLS